MNKQIINLVLGGIILLNFTNCKNEITPKENSASQNEINLKTEIKLKTISKKISYSVATFDHSEGKKKVSMIIEYNYKEKLIVGRTYNVNFKTENINSQNFKVSGNGIIVKKVGNDELLYTITPLANKIDNGMIEIQVTEQIENAENFSHKFLVPIKE